MAGLSFPNTINNNDYCSKQVIKSFITLSVLTYHAIGATTMVYEQTAYYKGT
jgi:hypothetical protein